MAVDVSPLRHFGGFVVAGSLAFVTDLGVFKLLEGFGVPPLAARLVSIPVAMVVSWLINRTVTFAMPGRPHLYEFLRFAGVAWISSAVNYTVFAVILFVWPPVSHTLAIVAATVVAMFVSYLGMRLAVFRKAA